ncbi:MAG: glycosyl hydrolase family 8 [Paludibacteraceae bacterium]|jgi:endo-1,4-beta-D-glucanase Y|nr:glycosyl hydrolase family 8 [Paludibacteraceae bacterium]
MKQNLLLTTAMVASMSFVQAQEIATWEDWAKSAITFTFDDGANEANSHSWAAEQLDKYGFKATFYVVTNWTSNWSTYQNIAKKGHEIGSHTDSHSGNSGELASSKATIERQIGQPCLTIAYPNCNEISNTLSYYIGGRICGGQTNSKSPSNLARFDCQICGTQGVNSQNQFTSRCSGANGGWMVFLIHGIQGREANGSYSPTSPDAFTGTLQWLNQNKKDYWVCTARDAIMYFKERDNSKFQKKSGDSSSETYTLSHSLDTKLCKWDYPLSVRVPMQDGWSDLKVTQDEKEIEYDILDGYVYFKAVPNGGDIVVGSGKPAVPDPEFTVSASASQYCKDSTYKVTWTMSGDASDRTYSLNWGTGSSSTEISVSTVKASSEWGETADNPYWTVDNILTDDGSHGGNSRWGSMEGSDEWVEFNFGKSQTVGGIKIDECTEYSTISSFEVQYDESGSWKTVYTGKTVGHDFSTTFDPVSTSKMRVFIKSTNDGAGCNINYVEFSGVAGYTIKDGINAAGSIDWKPKAAGSGMLTITNARGKVLAQTSSIKVENCGGGGDEPCTDCGGDDPQPVTGGTTFFDENGAYFGPSCDNGNVQKSGAYYTGVYPSPFKTYLGKTDEEIQKKLDQLWDHYFKGNDNSKVYYENGGEAYVKDINNNDVRSEGQSYGMMICVQTNHKTEFDKLWKFAKNHMLHTSGQWEGYFKWKCNPDGSAQDANCAPDGEMYFVTSLLLAANRWNEPSYFKDAQYCLQRFWKNGNGSLFNESYKIITFQPYNCSNFGDPSYDLPAFIELFARWSESNNDKWESCLAPTRGHLEKSCHSSSGLFGDYSEFDGTPTTGGFSQNSNKYMYDAMRCAMNVGMDYYLFGADKKTQNAMMTRLINHFEKDGYQHARFNWDGTGGTESYTLGECGANAVGCFALMDDPANDEKVKTNLKKAWNGQLMTGQYRYYDGLVHYLAMLHLCGSFKIYKPAPSVTEITAQNEYNGVKYDSPTDIYDFKDCKLYKVAIEITDVENVKANGVAIVPNPASNKINIVAEEQINSVEIIDMIGNKVVSTNSSEISVANLPAGVYMAVISTEKAQFVKKVMIKR